MHNLWITHVRGDAHVTGGVTPTSPLFVRGRGDAHVTQTVIPKPQVEPLGDPQVANPRTGAKYQAWRKAVLATCEPIGIRCGYPVDMTLPPRHDDGPSADHEPPLAETGDITPSLDGAGIAHLRCNRSHGGRLGAARRAANTTSSRAPRNPPRAKMLDKQDKPNRILENHQVTPAPPVGNTPKTRRNAPRKAVGPSLSPDGLLLPRLESGPHRACTGTYGPRARAWVERVYGMTLRGWQAYALDRALEHDAEGRLVWGTIIITVARQSGKSFLARALCLWRLHEGRELFGGEQTILHVANKRETAMEVMRPAALWAVEQYGSKSVKWGNSRTGIELPEGDRWLIHAANESAGVGYSVNLAFVDEAWKVQRTVVDDALAPTMAEMPDPQLYLVSTAGDSTSDLLQAYRQRAMDRLGSPDPGSVLLLEWSAPADADIDNPETWRWASPEWSERRSSFLTNQWANIDQTAFRTQYLNQWVVRADHWLKDSTWAATLDPDRDLPDIGTWIVALESDFDGMGHAVAVAAVDADDRIVVRVTTHRTIAEADAQVGKLRRRHPSMIVHATPSYIDRMKERIDGIVGQREAAAATQTLLDVLDRRALAHDGNQVLLEHFGQSTISRRSAGWVLTAPMGKSGVYAARAVMFAVWQASKVQKPAPMIYVRSPRAS